MKAPKRVTCPTCHGATWVICPECGGNREVPAHAPTPLLDTDAALEADVREARVLMRLEAEL